MLCGLVPPTFPLTALIEPFRPFAGGVVGFDERRRNTDRADGFPGSCNIMRGWWRCSGGGEGVGEDNEGCWRSFRRQKGVDVGEEKGYKYGGGLLCSHDPPGEKLWRSR